MTNPNNCRPAREVLAAWIVTLLILAVGLSLLAVHQGGPSDRMVLRLYDRPAASEEDGEEERSATLGRDWAVPQSGSSFVPIRPPSGSDKPGYGSPVAGEER